MSLLSPLIGSNAIFNLIRQNKGFVKFIIFIFCIKIFHRTVVGTPWEEFRFPLPQSRLDRPKLTEESRIGERIECSGKYRVGTISERGISRQAEKNAGSPTGIRAGKRPEPSPQKGHQTHVLIRPCDTQPSGHFSLLGVVARALCRSRSHSRSVFGNNSPLAD